MTGLPAILTRPAAVLDAAATGDAAPAAVAPLAADPTAVAVQSALDQGIPARTNVAADIALVLSVGAGQIRRYTDGDPADVLFAIGPGLPEQDPGAYRDPDAIIPRLTLVSGSALGDSAPVVLGQPVLLGIAGQVVAEVSVTALTITNGSLRSPGQFSSTLAITWRDRRPAPNSGPELPTGDPSIPMRIVWGRRSLLHVGRGVLRARYEFETARYAFESGRGWLS